jgi:hypothetical protein
MWLPVLVRVDPSIYAVSDPIPLPRPPNGALDVSGLTAGEDAVWALWPDGLVRVEEATGSPTAVSIPIEAGLHSMSVGGGAAWVLGARRIARVDARTGKAELFLEEPGLVLAVNFGFGHLWTLSRPDPAIERSVLSRYSENSPDRPARLQIEGAAQDLSIGDDAVWIRCPRRDGDGDVRTLLIGVAPQTLDAVEHEISNDEVVFAVGGEVWLGPALLSYDAHTPTELRRVDPTTWEAVGAIRAQGLVSILSVGPSGIWGLLHPARGGPLRVCRIDPDTNSVVAALDLADVDALPLLPPPPDPIDPEPVERRLRDDLAVALRLGGSSPEYNRGTMLESVVFDEVRLEGTFPKTEVIVLFRSH